METYLIYINKVGVNYKDDFCYEFIFSDTTQNIDGTDWDHVPASGRPKPPHKHNIKLVGKVETELELDLIQESDTFAVWDAVDGIIALGWENIDNLDVYPEVRLSFHFGETKESVVDKLYNKEITINF